MPSLNELLPDAQAVIALEPEELGLRLLPVIATIPTVLHSPSLATLVGLYARQGAPGQGGVLGGPYPPEYRQGVEQAIREAWFWLVGAALVLPTRHRADEFELSRRATKLAASDNPGRDYRQRSLAPENLHAQLRGEPWSAFVRGDLDTAVLLAMKAVEVTVRRAADAPAGAVGVKLMQLAFDPDKGPLTDMAQERGERVSRQNLFAGAIGSLKNPHSHREVGIRNPDEAIEILTLASLLLRITNDRWFASLL